MRGIAEEDSESSKVGESEYFSIVRAGHVVDNVGDESFDVEFGQVRVESFDDDSKSSGGILESFRRRHLVSLAYFIAIKLDDLKESLESLDPFVGSMSVEEGDISFRKKVA